MDCRARRTAETLAERGWTTPAWAAQPNGLLGQSRTWAGSRNRPGSGHESGDLPFIATEPHALTPSFNQLSTATPRSATQRQVGVSHQRGGLSSWFLSWGATPLKPLALQISSNDASGESGTHFSPSSLGGTDVSDIPSKLLMHVSVALAVAGAVGLCRECERDDTQCQCQCQGECEVSHDGLRCNEDLGLLGQNTSPSGVPLHMSRGLVDLPRNRGTPPAASIDPTSLRNRGRPNTDTAADEVLMRDNTEHYHCERNHQGLGNELIERSSQDCVSDRPVECRERLGGVLRYYRRAA